MKIVKELKISSVSGTLISNAPYKFTLSDPQLQWTEEKESSMSVDADTCARHSVSPSLDLVGRTLVCSFESHELPLKDEKYVNWGVVGDDNVPVKSLEMKEKVTVAYFQLPPGKNTSVSHILELMTHADGGRYTLLPCPFYRFFLDLTNEEYEECKALPAYTAFRASFSLKAVEVSEPAEQGAS